MMPLVVPFGRWPAVPTLTVTTVLDDPGRRAASPWPTLPDHTSRRCRDCHRRVVKGELRQGLGPKCWARRNAQPRRAGNLTRTPSPRPVQDGPDLLDLLEGRPAG